MIEQNEKSLVKTIDNIWYHYKWLILLGAFFLIFFTCDLIFCFFMICQLLITNKAELEVFYETDKTTG